MNEITWNSLTEGEQNALKSFETDKWITTDSMIKALESKGLINVSYLLDNSIRFVVTRRAKKLLAQRPPVETAKTGDGEAERYRDLYIQASGTLAVVASWLRGDKGDMNDLSAQQVYDMIASEQGLPPEAIEGLREQVTRLLDTVETLTGENKRLQTETSYLSDLLSLREVKKAFTTIFDKYQESDAACPYCNGDFEHNEDCKMLTVIAIVDGAYDHK